MGKNPVVTIEMESGDIIKIELYPDMAPNTVNNFIYLVNKGHYNGLIFHRVIENFMIQGGCPLGEGTGDAGYNIKGEFKSNGVNNTLSHDAGVISMARANPNDSASCQFFIMHKKSPHLDGKYAAFGKVIEGMDNVNTIATTITGSDDRPYENQTMKNVSVELFDVSYPDPEMID